MNKELCTVVILGSLLFIGCAEKNVVKEEVVKSDDNYSIVITKSIKDCKEHNIILDEQRTNIFMRKSPKATIDKAAKSEVKANKKLCTFFAEETSLEKIEKIDEFTSVILKGCEKVGVSLPKENIHKKVQNLPFFVIRNGLLRKGDASLEECEFMKKKYR